MRNFAYPTFPEISGSSGEDVHISLSAGFRNYLYIPLGVVGAENG